MVIIFPNLLSKHTLIQLAAIVYTGSWAFKLQIKASITKLDMRVRQRKQGKQGAFELFGRQHELCYAHIPQEDKDLPGTAYRHNLCSGQ